MDMEKIHEYQFQKLKSILEHCVRYVPFYRTTWNEYGIDLKRIQSFEDFSNTIPFVTRRMVQDAPDNFISECFPASSRLPINTGGSTGVPLALYYLKGVSRSAELAHMHVQWGRIGFEPGARLARLRGDYIGKDRIYSFDPWRNFLILSSFNLNINNSDEYLLCMMKYNIKYINAYPSSLFNLIQLSKFKSFEIPSLKTILLGSENIFDWQLKKIRDFFGVDRIYYWYGHGELCGLGGGCEVSSSYHFFPSYSYVEFVPDKTLIEGDNQILSEIVGTSFVNPLMPLVRYRTQDYGVEADGNCKCGRHHKILSRIIGREQDIAVGKKGEKITLTALIFGRHAEYFNHVTKIQIVNESPGKLLVRVEPKPSFESQHKDEIIRSLSRKEGMPFETVVDEVQSIDSTKRGKHRFFIRTFDFD